MTGRQLTTEIPNLITTVDQQFFEQADRLATPDKRWYSFYGNNEDRDFLDYVTPVVRKFRRYVIEKTNVRPRQIDIRYESFIVEPDEDALFGTWHVDSGVGVVGITSDILTPESVTSQHPLASRYLVQHVFTEIGGETVDAGLGEGWLQTVRPALYDLVDISERVHRSVRNDTGEPVLRHYMALITPEIESR